MTDVWQPVQKLLLGTPWIITGSLVRQSWNQIKEWIRGGALLPPGHSQIWLPTVDVFRTPSLSADLGAVALLA